MGVTDRYFNVFDVGEAGVSQKLYGNPIDCDECWQKVCDESEYLW